jgi:metal-responsive CopG/Arc/MetJ family transcriptional regulator
MEKLIPLTVTLPADVFEQIEEHARSLYLSRSAVARRLIIEHLTRRKAEATSTESEALS